LEKLSKEVLAKLSEAYLTKYAKEEPTYNPLSILRTEDNLEFEKKIAWLLVQPEYFSFLCKNIFNIQLLPFQSVILSELWQRKFPMLIASRGGGKLLRPDEKLRVRSGWTTMEKIQIGDEIYGSDGKMTRVKFKTELQTNVEMYRITLRDGRSIECCEDHLWKAYDKGRTNKWRVVSTKEMASNYYTDRKDSKSKTPKRCKEYRYAIPVAKPLTEEPNVNLPLHPYVVGVLLGDGSMTTQTITIFSDDVEIINRVRSLLPIGYKIEPIPSDLRTYSITKDGATESFYQLCKRIGIYGHKSENKFIPKPYLYASYEQKMELLYGLMDTGGTDGRRGGKADRFLPVFNTVSPRLAEDFLDLARSCGFSCGEAIYESYIGDVRYKDCYHIPIYTDKPIFSLPRKLRYVGVKKSKAGESKYDKTFITDIQYIGKGEGYCITVDNEDSTYITKDYIVTHNTFILALYCLMRAFLMPGRKIIVAGAGFRQSKFVYEYMETIWKNAPILRDLCDGDSGGTRAPDVCRFNINGSTVHALPIGDGSKIRGYRSNDLIADEFASHNREIFETVLAGFGNVSANTVESVQRQASIEMAEAMGLDSSSLLDTNKMAMSNQIVLSGTAFYDFNHFADYWRRWKAIVYSKGRSKELKALFPDGVPDGFDWKDYSVMRLPYSFFPKGFMDEGNVARSKASVHSGIYMMEYETIFQTDSQGFFKRSLLESCVANENNEVILPSGQVVFDALIKGNPTARYIIGVDPASEIDNFSIVVLELHNDHRRIVHCWTTTRQTHSERVKLGLTAEDNFYSYAARRIRDLVRVFPTERIMLDSQGGGVAVNEALHETSNLRPGEVPFWPVIEEDREKPTDDEPGLHIVELVNFAKAEWTSEANHGMRKDFEDKTLLFPKFDPIVLGLAAEQDRVNNKLYDTLEDCVMEIEEMKNELVLIEITQTSNGRDRWDTPDIKIGANKKKKMRKDRYSALLMANMGARHFSLAEQVAYESYGGFSSGVAGKKAKLSYIAPQWFRDAENAYDGY